MSKARQTPERQKERFVALRAEGRSVSSIASEMDLSPAELLTWQDDLSREIEAARYIRAEELAERYRLTRSGRLEVLGTIHERVIREIEGRDLTEVPTEKLVRLSLQLQEKIREELSEVRAVIAEESEPLLFDTMKRYAEIE